MQFMIRRASAYHSDTPPCEGAKVLYTYPYGSSSWGIELTSLEEFIELEKKVGPLILSGTESIPSEDGTQTLSYPLIEIYDDYIE